LMVEIARHMIAPSLLFIILNEFAVPAQFRRCGRRYSRT
jgi:hypothetical protein